MPVLSEFLFLQGSLDSELDGRIKRVREEVRDLDSADLTADDAVVARPLTDKYDLHEVTLQPSETELVIAESGDRCLLRIPFSGSGVLFHRSVGEASEPLPGRVVEKVDRTGGRRSRSSWLEIPVPTEVAFGRLPVAEWRAAVVAEITGRVAPANARLGQFRPRLSAAAEEAVRARRTRLARRERNRGEA